MKNYNTSGLSPEMLHIFETLPHPYLVLSRELAVLTASNQFLELTGMSRAEMQGRLIFDIFSEKSEAAGLNEGLSFSLNEVLRTLKPQKLPVAFVTFPSVNQTAGKTNYWVEITNTPVLNNEGNIDYILHQLKDVTAQVNSEQQLRGLNEELVQATEKMHAATEETLKTNKVLLQTNDSLEYTVTQRTRELAATANRLNRMISTTPIGLTIFRGPEFVIETANQPVLNIWGRKEADVVGKKLLEVFPELDGQPFPEMLRSVLETGKTVALSEIPVDVNQPDGSMKHLYVDFSYDALFDLEGKPEGILVSVKDITELAENRHLLQERREELEVLNEELAASNEKYFQKTKNCMPPMSSWVTHNTACSSSTKHYLKVRHASDN